jgi:hypothetical protein
LIPDSKKKLSYFSCVMKKNSKERLLKRNQQAFRSVQLAENVKIELSNPSNIWKGSTLLL